MDEKSPHRRDSRQSGSTSCSDRILDRRIERHGLPQSFSSNLARKEPPSNRKASDRSVRDMVSLFEKSTGTPDEPPLSRPSLASDRIMVGDKKKDRRRDHGSDKDTGILHSQHQAEQVQLRDSKSSTPSMFPSVQTGYQVEDYSLTLLGHKSYFDNRPLARCLDENHEKDKQIKIQKVQSRKENNPRGPLSGNKQHQGHRNGKREEENGTIRPPGRNRTMSPIQQLDSLMGELLTWQGKSGSGIPKGNQHQEPRDQDEIERYWRSVRTQLWVDENEIYGEALGKFVQESATLGKGSEHIEVEPTTSAPVLSASYNSSSEPEEPPPPEPTRPPPPVPAVHRRQSSLTVSSPPRQHSTTPSLEFFPEAADDYPTWKEPPSTLPVRLSISDPDGLDTSDLLPGGCHEPELPSLPGPGRPLPVPPVGPCHSRYPSSSSGHWVRPPTWRSPSSLKSSSPPPVPPLPVPLPVPPPTTARHHRSNHSRHRHPPHISSASTSISSHSVAATDSSGKSLQSRRTPKTSVSSVTTRSTRADSNTDLSAAYQPKPPRRRLTTEEKLSEIDAFLSPEREREERWI